MKRLNVATLRAAHHTTHRFNADRAECECMHMHAARTNMNILAASWLTRARPCVAACIYRTGVYASRSQCALSAAFACKGSASQPAQSAAPLNASACASAHASARSDRGADWKARVYHHAHMHMVNDISPLSCVSRIQHHTL